MSIFSTYLKLGFGHISDLEGYDHIVFLLALCAVYLISQWKEVLILVTAFTLGHSITLALATLNILTLNPKLIEFLIPVTIFATAIYNMFKKPETASPKKIQLNYGMAMFFGFIHGLGFSNYLKALLMGRGSLLKPLLAFNIGLELGQILIVLSILGIAFLVVSIIGLKQREWTLVISGAAAGISILLMIEKFKILIAA